MSNKTVERWCRVVDPESGRTGGIDLDELLNLLDWAYKMDRGKKNLDWEALADDKLVSRYLSASSTLGLPDRREELDKGKRRPISLSNLIRLRLAKFIDEEVCDSILPYLIPENGTHPVHSPQKSSTKIETAAFPKSRQVRSDPGPLSDVEVNIHVSDEFKNKKKDFKCPQRILMTKMSYFAEITSGQKLEEMDISVHCDIEVFEWIMNWVKIDPVEINDYPIPEASKVVAILVSAEFLQIEPLIKYCLTFIKNNINEVISATPNMSCISEYILGRLAEFFTNVELEEVVDERDKVLSRLFCKFIFFLSKPAPDVFKGHYSSLAFLYKCLRCQKFIHSELDKSIPCLPKYSRLDNTGNINGLHQPDASWSLNKHVYKLKQEMKNWRKIYWRLWGDCHFQFCVKCNNFYAVSQTNWCPFHKENPQFPNIQDRLPIGVFGCCGEKTFKFDVLPHPTGCHYKPHVAYNGQRNNQVFKIIEMLKNVIFYDPPAIKAQDKISKLIAHGNPVVSTRGQVIEDLWWQGLEISPSKKTLCLLLKFNPQKELKSHSEIKEFESPMNKPICERYVDTNADIGDGSPVIEDHTDESPIHLNKNCRRRAQHKCVLSPHNCKNWTPCLSNRNNQDNQRCNEERTIQTYREYIIKRGLELGDNKRSRQSDGGGLYPQVEDEWRHRHCVRGGGLLGGPTVPLGRPGSINMPAKELKGVLHPGRGFHHSAYKGAKGRGIPGKGRNHIRNYH